MGKLIRSFSLLGGRVFELSQGDITEEAVEAIVNAANRHLQHGGGVAAAISRRAGPTLQAESNAWVQNFGPIDPAHPAYTSAGALPCRMVIHAVGPKWGEGDEDQKLAAAVTSSLALADQWKLDSLAFPAISTGIYGFPKERAAQVMLAAVRDYFQAQPASHLNLVRITLLDQSTVDAFLTAWQQIFEGQA